VGAGALALPNVTGGSAGWSPHPLPLLGGLPHAAVPLSTRAEGEDGSPQELSAFEWTLGISPQPAETGPSSGDRLSWAPAWCGGGVSTTSELLLVVVGVVAAAAVVLLCRPGLFLSHMFTVLLL